MAQWGEALEKMKSPTPPAAGSPGMGAGNVPFAPGVFRQPETRIWGDPHAPGRIPGGSPAPATGGFPPSGGGMGGGPSGPPGGGPPGGPGGMPQMGPNPLQFQAEVLSTLMSAVMASIQRQKQRRMGGSGSGY